MPPRTQPPPAPLAAPPSQAAPLKSPRKTAGPNKVTQASTETSNLDKTQANTAAKAQASTEASNTAGTGTSNAAKTQTNKLANAQANTGASNPAGTGASNPANAQASNPTRPQASKPADAQTRTSANSQARTSTNAQARTSTNAQASRASNEGTKTGFFYGTLMFQEVFFKVCYGTPYPPENIRRRHTFKRAILHGHQRWCVKNASFPGVTPTPNGKVYGIFATGLTKSNMRRLDDFEGDMYDRKPVTVDLFRKAGRRFVDDGKATCETYIFKDPHDLDMEPWDPEEFRVYDMADYIGDY